MSKAYVQFCRTITQLRELINTLPTNNVLPRAKVLFIYNFNNLIYV